MNKLFLSTTVKSLVYLLLFSVALSCCKKSDTISTGPGTITAQVSSSTNLTLLKSAVIKAGLASTLDGNVSYTGLCAN
jgi:hypothetical protein